MDILYLTQSKINLSSSGIYPDLVNAIAERGHRVTIASAENYECTSFNREGKVTYLNIKVANQYGVGLIKKGLAVLSIKGKIKAAIKKYLIGESYDLILYATPPITLGQVVRFAKNKYRAKSYLMLKDIFPQNAIDIGLLSRGGIKGLIYKAFLKNEANLYTVSDRIGCMSGANIEYIKQHNPNVDPAKLELFPNSIVATAKPIIKSKELLTKYGIGTGKTVFIYGGNLGKPQGLDFLADGIEKVQDNEKAHFIVIGSGSEKDKLFAKIKNYKNVTTLGSLPTAQYSVLAASCDVGMIMLDYRFTIPNYPSRALAYLQNAMPIFACTDKVTDIKQLVETDANCGKWCYSNDIDSFVSAVKWFTDNTDKLAELGQNGYEYMQKNFNVDLCVKKIEDFMEQAANNK